MSLDKRKKCTLDIQPCPSQIILTGLRSSKDFYKRPDGVVGVYGKGLVGVSFLLGSTCAEGGGGLDGYFGEQGLPVGIQECLGRFHRGCFDYLHLKFDIILCLTITGPSY